MTLHVKRLPPPPLCSDLQIARRNVKIVELSALCACMRCLDCNIFLVSRGAIRAPLLPWKLHFSQTLTKLSSMRSYFIANLLPCGSALNSSYRYCTFSRFAASVEICRWNGRRVGKTISGDCPGVFLVALVTRYRCNRTNIKPSTFEFTQTELGAVDKEMPEFPAEFLALSRPSDGKFSYCCFHKQWPMTSLAHSGVSKKLCTDGALEAGVSEVPLLSTIFWWRCIYFGVLFRGVWEDWDVGGQMEI